MAAARTTTSRGPADMTTAEAAEYLGVDVRTLEGWRYKVKGPAYVQMGRTVRYRRADLDRFLDEHTVDTAQT